VAIASVDGVAEFRDVKIKNQRVISENGMVFVASTEHEAREYEAPKGVRSSQSKVIGLAGDLGMVLKVKAGDQVKKNDELVVLLAESDGEVRYAGKKSLIVSQFKSHEYYMSGTLKIEQNEDESALRFLAEGSGTVKIISYKSASNKTVDRKRVLIKDEREYVIPEGAQLKFENVIVNSGDDVKSGQKITGPIPFVSEIGGTVSVRDNFVKETVLLDSDLKPESIVDAVLLQDVVEKESGLKLKKGLLLDSETAQKIYAAREALGKLEVSVKSDSKRVIITNDETSVEYVTPSGVELLVADGEEIAEGTKIVNSFAPIVSEIDGKVNYITEYNRRTGEEMVRSILVYSGKDYFLSNTLQLCVKDKQKIEAGEPITDFIPFTRLEQTEKEIRFFCEERTEKKYTITPDMEILIQDGEVKKGDKIARLIADADGTIKLVHPITKSGKSSAVVERFHVQMGEVHAIPDGAELFVKDGQDVKSGDIIARWSSEGRKTTDIVQGLPRVSALFEVRKPKLEAMTASHSGVLRIRGSHIMIDTEKGSEKQLISSSPESLIVADGEFITAGQRLTEGDIDVKTYSETMGIFEAQAYMLNEVQYVYKTQNVGIHDKHIETILRRMVSKVKITSSGDSPFLAGDVVNAFEFKKTNEQLVAQNFKPATAVSVIQGISKASLTTDSFLSAASFQETTKVLTNAAIRSKIDNLTGLKENIIIGNLIPAGTGFDRAISYEFNDTRTVASASEQDLHDGNFAISIEGGDFSLDSEIQEAMGLRGFESSSVGFIDDIADDDFADDEEEADGFTEA
jgi:biotin carboxyl carrier protein